MFSLESLANKVDLFGDRKREAEMESAEVDAAILGIPEGGDTRKRAPLGDRAVPSVLPRATMPATMRAKLKKVLLAIAKKMLLGGILTAR